MSDRPPRPRQTFIRAFVCAGRGVVELFANGRNARIQLVLGTLAIALATWLGCSPIEWAVLCVTIGIVLAMEAINTSVELAVDLAAPDLKPLAGRSKDMAAGAVLIASIAACGAGVAILLPKLLTRIGV